MSRMKSITIRTFFMKNLAEAVFKISAGPRTLTGKIVVGPTEALTSVVRRSGNNFHGTVIPTNTVPHFKPYIHPHSIAYFSAIRFLSLSSWFVSVKLAILRCNGSRGWPLIASEKKIRRLPSHRYVWDLIFRSLSEATIFDNFCQ